jgi:CHAD domain-containing protein
MSPSPKSGGKGASRSKRVLRSRQRLNPVMACDSSFRVVARRCLADLAADHAATCTGDAEALHQMRVALARLRATISFFSLMVADSQRKQIRAELKWLHGRLGAVRDLDVAIGRLETSGKRRPYDYRFWKAKRVQSHRDLARASLSELSAADRACVRLDRERTMVHRGNKACRQKADLPNRGI